MKPLDITNEVFGRLVAIERIGSKNGRATWKCKCRCGNFTTALARSLVSGNTKSCGSCNDHIKYRNEYYSWSSMLQRCYNIDSKNYSHYGGRGITVCDRWKEDFLNFLADMGTKQRADHTLDRIDTDGNYEPLNCRWTNQLVQQNNRRNVYIKLF